MFTALALAAVIAASPAPVLVDDPYACPASAPWAIPSGSEAHPYECVVEDRGEQVADPAHPVKPTSAPTPAPSRASAPVAPGKPHVVHPAAHPASTRRPAQPTHAAPAAPVKHSVKPHPAALRILRRVPGDLTPATPAHRRLGGIPKHRAAR